MKRNPMVYISTIAVLAVIGVLVFNKSTRAGYESAEYKVIESDGNFEVREYPDLMLVATSTKIDAQGRDGSFMKLFRYISGANESEQKISMTTPVFMENDKADAEVQMGFVMPKEVAVEGVPSPTGADVDVRKRAGGRFAVIRFSGRLSAKLAKESETKLRAWMESKGLVPQDSPATSDNSGSGVESASYDPPFTPGPLRRNEVLIRLK
ncbi:SOUL family heme-binding protein [Rubripirellula reticaptiva]|uniref:SOUL heme-binding protein n=1 Tax=Rubripirellula reticaptiva TaxID=2528013 RepID=A0A5C6EE44_9BACT|nr:heme-binding protein [Rubripirellula reticaptiva]TWU46755.1 SOUL heme-binding protein [Rubripirellula reticaptiva]